MGLHRNLAGDDLHDPKGKYPSPLDIDNNTDQAYRIYETGTTTDYVVISTTDSAEEVTIGNTTTNPKCTIAGTGNVGLGTTSPAEKVDVSVTGANGGIRVKNDTDNAYLKLDAPADEAAYIDFSTAESNDWQIGRRPNSNDLTIYDNDGAADYVVTFEQGGNVGIGTTDPGEKLDISLTGGNGGLRVKNDTDNAYLKVDAPADEAAYIDFSTAESNDWQIGRRPGSNDLTVYDNDGAAGYVVTFEQGGNVGIGTTNPSTKLHVDGVVTVNGVISGVATPVATTDAANKAYVDGAASGISAVVEDTTPQLGGDLDCNGKDIDVGSGSSVDIDGGSIKASTGYGVHDEADNEQLLFSKTTSAVSYFQIKNAATGGEATAGTSTAPVISTLGETNVDLGLAANGTGTVTIRGNTNSGTLSLNNPANTYATHIKPPSDLGADYTLILPDDDGDANEVLQTDGSGNLSWVAQSGGGLTIATTSSATYSLSTYNTMVIVDSSSNAVEVDLPTASGNAGKTVDVLAKTGATNAVTVDPNGSETINGNAASRILNVDYSNITLVSDGSNWVIR